MTKFPSNTLFDVLKYGVEIVIPGFGTLYFTLGEIWGLPKGNEVVGTCAALALFLGLFVAYFRRAYDKSDEKYDGQMEIEETEHGKSFNLNFNGDPYDMDRQKEVRFKVDPK